MKEKNLYMDKVQEKDLWEIELYLTNSKGKD